MNNVTGTEPFSRDSQVATGSVTKVFTAEVLAALAMENRVVLNQELSEFWPGYARPGGIQLGIWRRIVPACRETSPWLHCNKTMRPPCWICWAKTRLCQLKMYADREGGFYLREIPLFFEFDVNNGKAVSARLRLEDHRFSMIPIGTD